MGDMEGIKGVRSEQQSDRAENHHQNGLDLGCFEAQKVRFFIKIVLTDLQNCASCVGGEHIFRKIVKTNCRKVKNGAKRR